MKVIDKRVTAEIEGDFVVFLIGMRINKLWKPWKWGPTFVAMPRMIRELERSPESGFLGARFMLAGPRSPIVVQYWRSFDHLEAYSRSHDAQHWPAWVAFNKRVGSSGDVGIWHETYLVPAGAYECVYNNMPPTGLGAVAKLVPASGRKAAAASRAGVRDEPYPAEAISGRIEL
jgi:hypothetical protein